MKKYLRLLLVFSVFFIWGCTNQKSINDLETEIVDLEDTIYKCNSQIENAKSYIWESYEEMEDALNSLETCN